MAEHANSTRRNFLLASAGALVSTTALAAAGAVRAVETPETATVSRKVFDAITKWQDADSAAKASADAYGASLRALPIDKEECGKRYRAYIFAMQDENSARNALMLALRRG